MLYLRGGGSRGLRPRDCARTAHLLFGTTDEHLAPAQERLSQLSIKLRLLPGEPFPP